jgi:S-adenosylmethionine synthetase
VAQGKYLFTSESVSMGHPDKLADQISDGVLDAYLAVKTRESRVACETMVTTGLAVIAGEITSKGTIDYQQVVRDVIREVGYTDDEMGIAPTPARCSWPWASRAATSRWASTRTRRRARTSAPATRG